MAAPTIPDSPVAMRREYLNTAREVATRQPTEESTAYLIALTQALLRDVCGEPALEIRIGVPRSAVKRAQAQKGQA
ncbi:hypothetical protein [Comamonas sp. C24C]